MDRETDRDVAGEQDLGRGLREVFRCEPPVESDDDALGRRSLIDDVLGYAVRAASCRWRDSRRPVSMTSTLPT